jgi:hypothetical protein
VATYFRDFSDADGISDWTERNISGTAPSWSVQNTDEVIATTSSPNIEALTWDDIDSDGDTDDIEILGQFYCDTTSTSARTHVVRLNSNTGYSVRLRTTTIDVYRFSGSVQTQVSSTSISISSGTWVWVRFRANTSGNVLKAKQWTGAAGDEPGTWHVDTTDSTYVQTGNCGLLHGAVNASFVWRKFGVGTNGDTAPSSAPASATSLAMRRAFPRPILNF